MVFNERQLISKCHGWWSAPITLPWLILPFCAIEMHAITATQQSQHSNYDSHAGADEQLK